MIKMGHDERQIIKRVVEQNLQRPWQEPPSQAAADRYRKQVKSAMELFDVVVDKKQKILIMANNFAVAKNLADALKRKANQFQYITSRHQLLGVSNCVVINVCNPRSERFNQERKEMFDVIQTLRDIDFWTFGDF